MCGRFGLFARRTAIEDRFDASLGFAYEPRYNIAPEGTGAAAIRNETPDRIDRLAWGLVPSWVDDPDDWPRPINARAESIAEKPTFRGAFAERRCLVPANGFYEWTGRRGERVPHWITVDDGALFAMAGVWDVRDEDHRSFAIVTTEANATVGRLHDRMPVILASEEEGRWLDAPDDSLLDPFPADRMAAHGVSRRVNDPTIDGPDLIDPVRDPQTGLDEF